MDLNKTEDIDKKQDDIKDLANRKYTFNKKQSKTKTLLKITKNLNKKLKQV